VYVCGFVQCVDVLNPDQVDSDGDGLGDLCDLCSGRAGGDSVWLSIGARAQMS
jgi:hypothetical protein